MSYKHIKFNDSEVLKEFEKISNEINILKSNASLDNWAEEKILHANIFSKIIELLALVPTPWGNPLAAGVAIGSLHDTIKNFLNGSYVEGSVGILNTIFYIITTLPMAGGGEGVAGIAALNLLHPKNWGKFIAWLRAGEATTLAGKAMINLKQMAAKEIAKKIITLKNVIMSSFFATELYSIIKPIVDSYNKSKDSAENIKIYKEILAECQSQATNYLDQCAAELEAVSKAEKGL